MPVARASWSVTRTWPRCRRATASDHSTDHRCWFHLAGLLLSRGEVAVEQDIAAHPEDAIARPMTVAQRVRRLQPNRRTAVADEQRCDRDVEAIDELRLQNRRHCDPASFNEYARAAARPHQPHQLTYVHAPVRILLDPPPHPPPE